MKFNSLGVVSDGWLLAVNSLKELGFVKNFIETNTDNDYLQNEDGEFFASHFFFFKKSGRVWVCKNPYSSGLVEIHDGGSKLVLINGRIK